MDTISTFLFVIGIIGICAEDHWVTYEDFSDAELDNITKSMQNREMVIQKLASREDRIVSSAFFFEIMAMGSNSYFFFFNYEEYAQLKSDAFVQIMFKNSAIIRAMLDCFKNLRIQDRVEGLLRKVPSNGTRNFRKLRDFSKAFTLLCSDIDSFLKNETLYVELRDKYSSFKAGAHAFEAHHFSILNSTKLEYGAMETVMNHIKIKKLLTNRMWIEISNSQNLELKERKDLIMELAKMSRVSEEVQKIYEQTIDEVARTLEFTVEDGFNTPWSMDEYFSPKLATKLLNKIMEKIPECMDYIECQTDGNGAVGSETVSQDSKQMQTKYCTKVQTKQGPFDLDNIWPVTSNFNSSFLDQLTLEQQHELFLKELAKKSEPAIWKFLVLESLAKLVGNDFFGLVKNEKENIQNNAIMRAVYDSMPNLKLKELHIRSNIFHVSKEEIEKAQTIDDIGKIFTQVCLKIDDGLKDESSYTTRRDSYLKQNLSSPKKTYQYGFGKPGEAHRQIIAKFLNEPELKRILVLSSWLTVESSKRTSDEEKTKDAITKMAKFPGKTEAVQSIFDQSVNETVKLFADVPASEIFPSGDSDNLVFIEHKARNWDHDRKVLSNQISSIMREYPDLAVNFTALMQNGISNEPHDAETSTLRPSVSVSSEQPQVGSGITKASLSGSVPSKAALGESTTSKASSRQPVVTTVSQTEPTVFVSTATPSKEPVASVSTAATLTEQTSVTTATTPTTPIISVTTATTPTSPITSVTTAATPKESPSSVTTATTPTSPSSSVTTATTSTSPIASITTANIPMEPTASTTTATAPTSPTASVTIAALPTLPTISVATAVTPQKPTAFVTTATSTKKLSISVTTATPNKKPNASVTIATSRREPTASVTTAAPWRKPTASVTTRTTRREPIASVTTVPTRREPSRKPTASGTTAPPRREPTGFYSGGPVASQSSTRRSVIYKVPTKKRTAPKLPSTRPCPPEVPPHQPHTSEGFEYEYEFW